MKSEKNTVSFCRNGSPTHVELSDPTETLLDFLRLREGSTGTKEGCCEGDCGACTVVVGEEVDGEITYKPINSCITLLGMVNGKDVITVDDLASNNGTLHPVQQAMIDKHGSQCGFCTPGFVMSLFALYEQDIAMHQVAVKTQLAGNLCRCTGYRPIVEAGVTSGENRDQTAIAARKTRSLEGLHQLKNSEFGSLFIGDDDRFFAQPNSVTELASLYEKHPDATIVAGATDVGLWVTKHLADLPKIIHIGAVEGFTDVQDTGEEVIIGAGATYVDAHKALAKIDPDIDDLITRIGSVQVRSAGTVGGNIANGSPIGDTPPLLIALNAQLTLMKGEESRTLPLEDFFISYGKQDRMAGEFVHSVYVPKLKSGDYLRTYKLSKRFDQDISAVMMAIKLTVAEDLTITDARIAFGGMAETPKRAAATEQALTSQKLGSNGLIELATSALAEDFAPISDMRASASYRLLSAAGLLEKSLIEIAAAVNGLGTPKSRIIGRTTSMEVRA
jgi:xanthine dehydrogenase small subunit